MKRITFAVSLAALLLSGCNSTTKEAKVIPAEKPAATQPTTAQPTAEAKAPVAKAASQAQAPKAPKAAPLPVLSKFYEVFGDGAQIAPQEGKPMLLVFGQSADPYTQKLQADITDNPELAKTIQDTTTPVYINASSEKQHKFMHNGEMMDVDTKTLVSIYQIDSTPTLIFTDDKAQSIFIVPGYMPPKQFEVTLQFLNEKVWEGKDRKNGDVYKALKSYYESHGIDVGKAKK
jgi:thioredoxin-related protein